MNQTFEEMSKLTRENRKLRKTLRSRSATPSRRRKEASDSEGEEEEESEGESEDSGEESEETEPMSSEEEEDSKPRSRSKSRERGRSASRRTSKEKKPKGRSQRMMSVQRPDMECEDSFEEEGEIEEDIASSEKLLVEIDHEYKDILDRTRSVLLEKVEKLQEVAKEDAGIWFDETGSLTVENQLKGAIRELRRQILDIDVKLMELAESEQERERKKGKEESKDGEPPNVISQENEQAEQALMGNEEVLAAEFRSDCATEWNRRRLAQEYASVDGEGFGRDGIYRIDRFGCMEMYVGEFDEDPPSVPSATELWELYVGGEVPEDILKTRSTRQRTHANRKA